MGHCNNDTKGIALRLLWNHNIAKVCEQYQHNLLTYYNDSCVVIFNKHYNWRPLQKRSFDGSSIWDKRYRSVCKLPKNY